ncbi:glycosyltransferase [Candidatus Uhrbacteria bacterium]|nr:glycosyltransferase [Candidatus Uhrbacteria bacterium]MBD3283866.1 glycosyltransferase [Candidatus Uhrbacteria bacterium]
MEEAKKLVINIVTWNSARYLRDLFASMDTQTTKDFSVSIVDNASADETLVWLQEHRSEVALLRNFRNQGFARAHNQGIAMALSRWERLGDLARRYILLLNPDTVLDATCIAQLISYMDTHPEVAIAGPKLLRAIRPLTEDGEPGDVERTRTIDSTGIQLMKRRVFLDRGAGEEDGGQYDHEEPFGISGAAMLLRASAITDLEIQDRMLFDEEYFAYKEDVDLCWRARLLGRQIALVPTALAWHFRTAKPHDQKGLWGKFKGQRSRSGFVNYLSRRNQIWTEWKNDDVVNRFMHLLWRIPQRILRLGSCVFPSHLRAVIDAWRGRGRMQEKRKQLHARRKRTPDEMRAHIR